MSEPLKIRIERTAEANRVKITVNRTLTDRPGENYADAGGRAANPVARAVLGVAGVRAVYLLGNFMTVTKSAGASWRRIGPTIQTRLHQVLGGRKR